MCWSPLRKSTLLIRKLCRCGQPVLIGFALFVLAAVAPAADERRITRESEVEKLPPPAAPVLASNVLPTVAAPPARLNSLTNAVNNDLGLPPPGNGVDAAWQFFAGASNSASKTAAAPKQVEDFQARLQIARNYRLSRQFAEATAIYAGILESAAPDPLQHTALIEMGQTAQDDHNLVRAQQIYAQCVARWPQDEGVPELILHQGLIYRQMGLNNFAIAKFYTVMTSALSLKPERFEYYQKLVLRAQNEIAGVQFELGNWAEAAESLTRLLRMETPPENHSAIQYTLIRCLIALDRNGDVFAQAQDFLNRDAAAPERPEVRFLFAVALKRAGRNDEALRQILALLQEQHTGGTNNPANLTYWQHRAGNELANQFYQEGEPMKALDIYQRLAALDASPEWQIPVCYQLGLVFERLNQLAKAVESYENIGRREKELTASAAPSLKSIVEMARWRLDLLGWRLKSETTNREFHLVLGGQLPPPAATTNSTNPIPSQPPSL